MRRSTGEWIGIATVLLALSLPTPVALSLTRPAPGPPDTPPPLPSCDGTPPALVNKDVKAHAYRLTCGKKVEEASIPAGESQSLEGKSGCILELGENKATKHHTEMVCTIEGGVLGCDLL